MSRHAGIGRDQAGLAAIDISDTCSAGPTSPAAKDFPASVEAANLALAARAVTLAAAYRTESRGCHVRMDFPERRLEWAQPISLTLVQDQLIVADFREAVAS